MESIDGLLESKIICGTIRMDGQDKSLEGKRLSPITQPARVIRCLIERMGVWSIGSGRAGFTGLLLLSSGKQHCQRIARSAFLTSRVLRHVCLRHGTKKWPIAS